MGVQQYRVLAAAQGRVVGEEHETGELLLLSDAEARFDLDLGRIEPTGVVPPVPPSPPPAPRVQASDVLLVLRGANRTSLTVGELEDHIFGSLPDNPSDATIAAMLPGTPYWSGDTLVRKAP